ncbi:MAG: sugar transferase [Rhodopseudomonas palustris]|nr:sugar transferase [Rhodopseudomonas palustris]
MPIELVPDSSICRVLDRPVCRTRADQGGAVAARAAQRGAACTQAGHRPRAGGLRHRRPVAAVRGDRRGGAAGIEWTSCCSCSSGWAGDGRPFRIYKFRTMTTADDGAVIVQSHPQ